VVVAVVAVVAVVGVPFVTLEASVFVMNRFVWQLMLKIQAMTNDNQSCLK
jgi:hypothetical protein